MNTSELLLQNLSNKYTIFPVKYADIWNMFITHKKAIWFVDEVDLSKDLTYWKELSKNEQHFIKHVLAFFAASDGIVMENLASRFCNDIQIAEARAFYAMQMFIENEHSIMYSRLIETYIGDEVEKDSLFNAIETMPAIQKKAEWAKKWIESGDNFASRLVAFAAVEGIFFSGSFCCIYWLKEKGTMPGLCMSNDFIARDESIHCEFAILLYTQYIQNKLEDETFYSIIKEAVEIEKEFITESLPCSLLGMNATLMAQYIEFVANRLIMQLGYNELYPGIRNPFSFMERICLESATNFFDKRETNYQMTVKTDSGTASTNDFEFDEDF